MKSRIPDNYIISKEIIRARQLNAPIVALETTVLTHGLPFPKNIELAGNLVDVIQAHGATPATIGVLKGKVVVGMSPEQINNLVDVEKLRKISNRDFGVAITKKESGGTTVAGTLVVANNADIRVFATGGIGGVHRDVSIDVSADLPELSRSPVVVVCAGAKAILDLPATLEYLETAGVPVVGYKTDKFPAFYARDSGLSVSVSVDTPEEVAEIAKAHWGMGLRSAVLVAVPPPENVALPMDDVWNAINQSLAEANENGIRGQAVTPFLLARVNELTGNASLTANLGLLLNNGRVAAQIAIALTAMGRINIA